MNHLLFPPSPLLAVWSFASAWMLLWGLAALVPILIHLLSRRTRRTTAWAAMEFLQAALRKNARRLRLEQWLLLAVRTLAILLIALAWADPSVSWLPALTQVGRPAGQTHTVLILDGSYSMRAEVGGVSRWAAAQQKAQQRVSEAVRGDGFSLLLMAAPPQAVIAEVAFDSDDVQQELVELAPTQGGADLAATLAEADRLLRIGETRHARLVRRRLIFFTDLARPTWDAVFSQECRQRLRDLSERAAIELVEVADRDEPNWAVTRLAAGAALPVVGDRTPLEVEVESFAREDSRKQVELLIDGNPVSEKTVAIPARGRATTTFLQTWNSPGDHRVEVRLSSDALELDNRRFLSVPVRETLRVLCIEGEQNAAQYLALALDPGGDIRSRIRPETAAENALIETDLSRFDCVWLCNVGRFGREEANLLYRYVAAGGALIVSLGDQCQAENYNQELGGAASGHRLLPARLGSVVGDSTHRFDPRGYAHPLVEPFRGQERSGLISTPVWRYLQLVLRDDSRARVALQFENGDPALVEESIGRGQVVLLATAVSLSSVDHSTQPPTVWTALPTWPSFPPLVHTMLQFAVSGQQQARNTLVGEPLVASLHSATAALATVTTPENRTERIPARTEGAEQQWIFDGTWGSGFYQLQYGQNGDQTSWFAVNLDTRESDLSLVERDMLPSQFREAPPEPVMVSAGTAVQDKWPLFRLVLLSVVALLLAETVLAWRLGGAPG